MGGKKEMKRGSSMGGAGKKNKKRRSRSMGGKRLRSKEADPWAEIMHNKKKRGGRSMGGKKTRNKKGRKSSTRSNKRRGRNFKKKIFVGKSSRACRWWVASI